MVGVIALWVALGRMRGTWDRPIHGQTSSSQSSDLGAGSEGCSRCLCGKEAAPSASKPGVCPVHWAQKPEKRSTSKQTNKQTNRAWWCQHMGILAVPGLGRTLDLLQVIWELINQPECGQNSETNGGETAT